MLGSKALIIVGAGGAGAEALWTARRITAGGGTSRWEVLGFADDNAALRGTIVEGAPVLGSTEETLARHGGQGVHFYCAIGSNRTRRRVADIWEAAGFAPATLIDPAALVSPSAEIGAGTYVGATAIVSARARVGRHVLVNFAAMVAHDCTLGDFVQLCPGARMNGACGADTEAFLGANATMAPGTRLGAAAVLGAASFTTCDVPDGVTSFGVPARPVFSKRN